jgi:hypothetical protein
MGNYAMNTIVRKQSIISNSKLLLLSRVLLLTAALGILVVSLFNSDPDKVTIGHTFAPLWDQVLIYGGTVVLIVLFSWLWPVFGGIITVLYGSQQIIGGFRMIQSGHIETAIPVSVYYSLYALLIAGGIIGISAGMRRKTALAEDTDLTKRLRKIALIVNLSLAGTATFFGFALLIISITYHIPDYLVASAFFLLPALLIFAWIAWMWPAQGGLLEIVNGVFWLNVVYIPTMEPEFSIPYVSICGILITAGCMNISRGYLLRRKQEVDV